MTNNQLTDLRTLILSEVGDFFAGVGSPGEPGTPEEMQRELSMRLGRILNNHIVNYPRCEALVGILRECRIARDEAQAELQERRKAERDSEPVAYMYRDNLHSDARFSMESKIGNWSPEDINEYEISETPLYRHAQHPVVPDERAAFNAWNNDVDCPLAGRDAKSAAWMAWNYRATFQAGNSPVIPEWIPVSERMPETDGNYWGWWSESKRQGPVWFIKSELQAQFQSSEITHWMPLPAGPQEVKGES